MPRFGNRYRRSSSACGIDYDAAIRTNALLYFEVDPSVISAFIATDIHVDVLTKITPFMITVNMLVRRIPFYIFDRLRGISRDLSEATLGIAKREQRKHLSGELRIEFPNGVQQENYTGYQKLTGHKKGRARNTSFFSFCSHSWTFCRGSPRQLASYEAKFLQLCAKHYYILRACYMRILRYPLPHSSFPHACRTNAFAEYVLDSPAVEN